MSVLCSVCMCVCVCVWRGVGLKERPGGSDGKESACNAGDPSLIPGLGRSPGEWQPTPVFLPGEVCEQSLQSMGSRRVGHD